jgi:hypothetical protein
MVSVAVFERAQAGVGARTSIALFAVGGGGARA